MGGDIVSERRSSRGDPVAPLTLSENTGQGKVARGWEEGSEMRGIETRRRRVDQRDVLRGDKFLGAISASLPPSLSCNPSFSNELSSFFSHQPHRCICTAVLTSLPYISETLDNAATRGIRFIRLRCSLRLNSRRDLEIVHLRNRYNCDKSDFFIRFSITLSCVYSFS